MSALLLALALIASPSLPQSIDVIVLSKHRPQRLRLLEGQCRFKRLEARTLAAQKDLVRVCAAPGRCRKAQTVTLRCARPAQVAAKGLRPRTYGRTLSVRAQDGALRVIATLDLETYVGSVVRSELARAPLEAKKAQAIVARTYAVHAAAHPRHQDAPLCDLTHCQVFAQVRPEPAAKATAKRVLRADGALAEVFYHSTCGGQTVAAQDVWPKLRRSPVIGVSDRRQGGAPWCKDSPHIRWIQQVPQTALAEALRAPTRLKLHPQTLALRALDPLGLRWRVEDRRRSAQVSGAALHSALGRALGWGQIKSARFEAQRLGDTFLIKGTGLGHGVGLCQVGARARAEAGQSAEQILKAYFPKLKITPR